MRHGNHGFSREAKTSTWISETANHHKAHFWCGCHLHDSADMQRDQLSMMFKVLWSVTGWMGFVGGFFRFIYWTFSLLHITFLKSLFLMFDSSWTFFSLHHVHVFTKFCLYIILGSLNVSDQVTSKLSHKSTRWINLLLVSFCSALW